LPDNARRAHPLSIRLRYAGPLVFVLAFGVAVWRSCPDKALQLLSIPDLPALSQAEVFAWPVAIDSYLLREGDSEWPAGGRLFVLPDAVRLLPAKGLFGRYHAAALVNSEGANHPWGADPNYVHRAKGYVLPAAAALVADWWRLRSGQSLGKYQSKISREEESGVSPLALAALYEKRSADNPDTFSLSNSDDRDPWTGRRFPVSVEGMARLLEGLAVAPGEAPARFEAAPEGWPGTETLGSDDVAMTGAPIRVWPGPEGGPQTLCPALRHYGVLLAGVKERLVLSADRDGEIKEAEVFHQPAAAVIGCYEFDGKPLFLLRYPISNPLPEAMGYSFFAFVPTHAIAEAWAFPHPLKAEWKWIGKGVSQLSVSDCSGRGVAIDPGREIRLEFDGTIQALAHGLFEIRPGRAELDADLSLSLTCHFYMPPPGRLEDGRVRLTLPARR